MPAWISSQVKSGELKWKEVHLEGVICVFHELNWKLEKVTRNRRLVSVVNLPSNEDKPLAVCGESGGSK